MAAVDSVSDVTRLLALLSAVATTVGLALALMASPAVAQSDPTGAAEGIEISYVGLPETPPCGESATVNAEFDVSSEVAPISEIVFTVTDTVEQSEPLVLEFPSDVDVFATNANLQLETPTAPGEVTVLVEVITDLGSASETFVLAVLTECDRTGPTVSIISTPLYPPCGQGGSVTFDVALGYDVEAEERLVSYTVGFIDTDGRESSSNVFAASPTGDNPGSDQVREFTDALTMSDRPGTAWYYVTAYDSGGDSETVMVEAGTVSACPTVTCLLGNGRIDVNAVNPYDVDADYVLTVGELSPRAYTVAPNTGRRSPVLGRPDGSLDVTLTRNGQTILDETVTVDCDDESPSISADEVVVYTWCIGGRGMVWAQFANPAATTRDYVLAIDGFRRSASAAPFGAAYRGISGRSEGNRIVEVLVDDTVLYSEWLLVNCR